MENNFKVYELSNYEDFRSIILDFVVYDNETTYGALHRIGKQNIAPEYYYREKTLPVNKTNMNIKLLRSCLIVLRDTNDITSIKEISWYEDIVMTMIRESYGDRGWDIAFQFSNQIDPNTGDDVAVTLDEAIEKINKCKHV